MNLLDIISLAKAGYKKADIDELLAIQVDEPEDKPEPDSTDKDAGPEGGAGKSPEGAADDPDYKQMYEDLQKQLEEVKINLKEAQDANLKKNVAVTDPDPADTLADIVRGFM